MVNYSTSVKKALSIAEKVALKTGGLIGTEHILFGMLYMEDTIACRVLNRHNITKDLVVNYINPTANVTITLGESMYSPGAKNVKQLAGLIAESLQQNRITTEHFLLAIIDNENCVAARILSSNGIDLTAMKNQFLTELRNNKTGVKNFDFSSFDVPNDYPNDRVNNYNPTNAGYNDYQNDYSNNYQNDYPNDNYDRDVEYATVGRGYEHEDDELDKLGIDLTLKASRGKVDPVIGRDDEIDRLIQVLCRRTKNSPVLVGEPGVGKSAIADGLALKIVNNDVPDILKGKRVFSLDMASVVAGTKYRGEFEERFKNALDTIKRDGNIILFIDEIHTIVDAGSSEGSLDAANILKPMLARGEIQTIGATTFDEYRKYIEKDPALERRFQPVIVEPPSVENTILILKGLRSKYEMHHKVQITDDAIIAASKMADRYITDRFMPDKAIDLIDEAASKKRIEGYSVPDRVKQVEQELQNVSKSLNEAKLRGDYMGVENLLKYRDELFEVVSEEKRNLMNVRNNMHLSISADDIAEVVADWTHIPVTKLTEDESSRLMKLEDILKQRVIGQNEAVASVARAIKRARAGLQDPNRPIGSFIFLGPTGVGKTELSKAIAEAMFGDENLMIRVDMSEYMDKSTVSKLIGSAPGLVGYEEGGQLTEKVRRQPYSVVLFDEIEKAHPDIFNILLQVLDDGRITDGHGRTVNFKNTIIIMTSNLGATDIKNTSNLGFATIEDNNASDYERMKEAQISALKKAMRPEFVNRIDEVIVFRKLSATELTTIADILLDKLQDRLKEKGITMQLTPRAKQYVVTCGTDVEYGARPLRRTIQRLIEDRLSEEILKGTISRNDNVVIDVDSIGLFITKM